MLKNKSSVFDQIQAHVTQEGGKILSSQIQEIINLT
jgi:hypothetical protein